jgi:hypothetical protein
MARPTSIINARELAPLSSFTLFPSVNMSVNAILGYLADEELFLEERPYCLKFEAPAGLHRSDIQVEHRQQTIEDIRRREKDFTIDKNRFTLVPFDTKMAYEDFNNKSKIVSVYLAEAAEKLQRLVGAFHVQIFEYVTSLPPLLLESRY